MFQLCEAMQWAHLPVAGGIYDQDPDLLDGFLIIFAERSKWEHEEQQRRNRGNKGGSRVAGRRRSR